MCMAPVGVDGGRPQSDGLKGRLSPATFWIAASWSAAAPEAMACLRSSASPDCRRVSAIWSWLGMQVRMMPVPSTGHAAKCANCTQAGPKRRVSALQM